MSWIVNVKNLMRRKKRRAATTYTGLPSDPSLEPDLSLLEELPGVLESLNDSTRRFNDVAQQQNHSLLQQSATLHQVAVTAEEFVATSKRIADHADSVENSALRGLEGCEKGKTTVRSSMKSIEAMAMEVSGLGRHIRDLGERNRRISGVADIITEITEQLNLLALNAQIEAAGAGASGKRFWAVAQEVKRLADTSRESAADIRRIIAETMNDVNRLVDSARRGLEATETSLHLMGEIAGDLNEIHDQVENTHVMAREIKLSTHQQTSAQQELSCSISDMDAQTTKNSQLVSTQVSEAITNLSDLSQYLTLILESTILKDDEGAGEVEGGIVTEVIQ